MPKRRVTFDFDGIIPNTLEGDKLVKQLASCKRSSGNLFAKTFFPARKFAWKKHEAQRRRMHFSIRRRILEANKELLPWLFPLSQSRAEMRELMKTVGLSAAGLSRMLGAFEGERVAPTKQGVENWIHGATKPPYKALAFLRLVVANDAGRESALSIIARHNPSVGAFSATC